jgi:hypothetical protein
MRAGSGTRATGQCRGVPNSTGTSIGVGWTQPVRLPCPPPTVASLGLHTTSRTGTEHARRRRVHAGAGPESTPNPSNPANKLPTRDPIQRPSRLTRHRLRTPRGIACARLSTVLPLRRSVRKLPTLLVSGNDNTYRHTDRAACMGHGEPDSSSPNSTSSCAIGVTTSV